LRTPEWAAEYIYHLMALCEKQCVATLDGSRTFMAYGGATNNRLPTDIKARFLKLGEHLLSQIHRRLVTGLESESESGCREDDELCGIRVRFQVHTAEVWILSSAQRSILQPEPRAMPSALYSPRHISGIRCSFANRCYQTVFFRQRIDRSNKLLRFAGTYHDIKLKHGWTWGARRQCSETQQDEEAFFHD